MSISKICRHCNGTGREQDNKFVGREARKGREAAGIGLRVMASLIGVSPSFLSQLERGERNWTPEVVRLFARAINEAR